MRDVLRRHANTSVMLGEVEAIDLGARRLTVDTVGLRSTLAYDSLILAAGAGQSYFGHPEFARYAPDGYGGPQQRAITHATPDALRSRNLPNGSMGPKVEAACRFVESTGGRAVIGSLSQVPQMLDGRAGTQIAPVAAEFRQHEIGAALS